MTDLLLGRDDTVVDDHDAWGRRPMTNGGRLEIRARDDRSGLAEGGRLANGRRVEEHDRIGEHDPLGDGVRFGDDGSCGEHARVVDAVANVLARNGYSMRGPVRIAAGEIVIRVSARPETRRTGPAADVHRLAAHLTGRERECLALLVDGLSTAGMAARLGVSQTTVRTHVQALLTKLGVHSRLEAASLAVRHDLVEPPSDAEVTAAPN